jgi:hypothetical protein
LSLYGKHEDLAVASERIQLMIGLVLLATVPVILGIVIAGFAQLRYGTAGLWIALGLAGLAGVLLWGAQTAHAPLAQRFGAPVAVYFPALLLAGAVLTLTRRRQWTPLGIGFLALGIAVLNVWLAQSFFVAGCAAAFWECP